MNLESFKRQSAWGWGVAIFLIGFALFAVVFITTPAIRWQITSSELRHALDNKPLPDDWTWTQIILWDLGIILTIDKLYALYYLAIHTGMRQAELLGLKWEDINWKLATLRVNRQVRHFKGSSYAFLKPKTKSGNRPIALGKKALEILRRHKEEQETVRKAAGKNWTDLDLVFPSSVGTPHTASNLRRDFRKLLEASALPHIRFHDLRHTAASLMLNHGVPVLVVSKRLGHSKVSLTVDTYGHLLPSEQQRAAEYMDGVIEDE